MILHGVYRLLSSIEGKRSHHRH